MDTPPSGVTLTKMTPEEKLKNSVKQQIYSSYRMKTPPRPSYTDVMAHSIALTCL